MKLYIKYMVSLRCKMAITDILNKMNLHVCSIELGIAIIEEILSLNQINEFKILLEEYGFEFLEDKKIMLIERIKNIIIDKINSANYESHTNFTKYIRTELNLDYNYLADLFAEFTGHTIQNFIILQKIEKVKELLLYDELNLTEISYKLDYSSVAHLSNQFKKVTGLTPSYYKRLKEYKSRINIETI